MVNAELVVEDAGFTFRPQWRWRLLVSVGQLFAMKYYATKRGAAAAGKRAAKRLGWTIVRVNGEKVA